VRDRTAEQREALPDPALVLALVRPDPDDLDLVVLDVAHHRAALRTEELCGLLGHDVEEVFGRLRRGCDRDAADGGLLARERLDLATRLRVRERDRDEPGELLEPLLGVRLEVIGLGDRDRRRAPHAAGDDDRRGDPRRHAAGLHLLADVVRCVLEVDPRGSAGPLHHRDRSASVRQARADLDRRLVVGLPASDDLGYVRVVEEANDRSAPRAEQSSDFFAGDVEEPLRLLLGGHGDGDPAQSRLLVGERRERRQRVGICERDGDERGELLDPALGSLRDVLLVRDADDDRSPELAGHLDRGGDHGRRAELAQATAQAWTDLSVVDLAA
jgi:hypothetical protein